MPEYNNAAGRILNVLEKLQPHHGKNCKLNQLAEALGVTPTWPALLTAIQDLHEEFAALQRDRSV